MLQHRRRNKKKILLVLKMHRKKVLLFWLADKNVIFTLCSLLSQKRMSLKRF
jgi:hypothetical protein